MAAERGKLRAVTGGEKQGPDFSDPPSFKEERTNVRRSDFSFYILMAVFTSTKFYGALELSFRFLNAAHDFEKKNSLESLRRKSSASFPV